MITAKRRGRPRKDRASMAPSKPSRAASQAPSGEDELEGPSAPPTGGPSAPPAGAASGSPGPSNQEPTPTASSVPKYSEDDLRRILKMVLESMTTARDHPDEPRERPLKPRAPDVYKGKSRMDCYNFIQQCEDHFATCGARGNNRVPFAATFLKERALFRWQHHKRKLEAETLVPITWDEFKTFLLSFPLGGARPSNVPRSAELAGRQL